MSELPAAIARFIEATNSADSDGFLDAFTEDATLDDWGREFAGRSDLARWNSTDNIGVQAHFDLVEARPGAGPDEHVVTLRVTGNGYNGTGPMTFTLAGDRIARLVIAG